MYGMYFIIQPATGQCNFCIMPPT